jgi:peptidyl-prolyl cis-trans isomerase C
MTRASRMLTTPPGRRYHVLRAALAVYGKTLSNLDETELAEVEEQAARAYTLETQVLTSSEAATVVVSGKAVDAAVASVAERYATRDEYRADLAANGIDEALIRRALMRELAVERVLERVADAAPPVTQAEVVAYYQAHTELFQQPELRTAYQILVTINPGFPENTRAAASVRVTELVTRLRADPSAFSQMAERWSECPSALRGGLLGTVPRGRLAPEIDAMLFTLAAGEIGEVVETELGLHIVRCEAVLPARLLPLDEVSARIRARLERDRRAQAQQAWLRHLSGAA